ncbi:glycosyl hydrolase family 18 protein [Cellvibrio sp. pealriver]|uniref:glycosyl hydrolase family 18 protein n=1 Tax=Cellvibrio sp. pealriver TaxID=1622269 RepID=UPI00066FE4A9|nr:glycosyl hydrolase family 18 protein [Cellvibrio sp. pealriver]
MKQSLFAVAGLCLAAASVQSHAISCAGIPQWNSSTAYGGGSQVQEAGKAYKANWWSQGHSPASYSSQWQEWALLGTCDGASSSAPSSVRSSSAPSSIVPSSSARSSSAPSSIPSSRSSSSVAPSSSSVGGNCASSQYVAGTAYSVGQLVKNAGNEYRCTVAGWCSSTAEWAYAPGTGAHWQMAWELVRSCGVVSSSSAMPSSVASSSRSSVSSSVSSVGTSRYRIISGYWHNFNNGSGVIPLDQVSDAYDAINVSFAEPTGRAPGEIGFVLDPAFNMAAFKAAIKSKQAAGKKVIISIGGANGQVQLPTAAARANFVNSMKAIIDEYGFDGLDVDFEGHSLFLNSGDNDFRNPTTPVIVNLIGALQDLTNHYGDKFVLTMAPETFFVQLGYSFYGGTCSSCDTRAGAYLPVIYAMRDKLDWLQVQNYNSGAIMGTDNKYHYMGGADFHVAMIDMLLTGFKVAGTNLTFPALRQDQVLIGLPANVNAGGGFTSVADVQSAMNCLIKAQGCTTYQPAAAWSNLRGLMTWSINWDQFNNFEFSKNHRQYLDQLPTP